MPFSGQLTVVILQDFLFNLAVGNLDLVESKQLLVICVLVYIYSYKRQDLTVYFSVVNVV